MVRAYFPIAPVYHICPSIGKGGNVYEIYIRLQTIKTPALLEKEDDVVQSGDILRKSFEDVTGKTIEDFYQLFTQSKMPACFDTPRKVWYWSP